MARQFSRDKGIWIPAGGGLIQPKGVDVLLEQGISVEEWVQTHEGEFQTLQGNVLSEEAVQTIVDDSIAAIPTSEGSTFWTEPVNEISYVRNYPGETQYPEGSPPTGSVVYPYETLLDYREKKYFQCSSNVWDAGRDIEEGERFLQFQEGSSETDNGSATAVWFKMLEYNGTGFDEYSLITAADREAFYIQQKESVWQFTNNILYTNSVLPLALDNGGPVLEVEFHQDGGFTLAPGYTAMKDSSGKFERVALGIPTGYVGFIAGVVIQLDKQLELADTGVLFVPSVIRFQLTKNGSPTGGALWDNFDPNSGLIQTISVVPGFDWGHVFYPEQLVGVSYTFGSLAFAPTDLAVRIKLKFVILPDSGQHGFYNYS